jgi:GTP cyclohydrolase I
VGVWLEIDHICGVLRGTQRRASRMLTSSFGGEFRTDIRRRLELFEALGAHGRAQGIVPRF